MFVSRVRHFVRHIRPSFTRSMSVNEETAAMLAAAKEQEGKSKIFDKILDKSIPSDCVYENDYVYCFRDIQPQAPTHVLCIPKDRDGLTGIKKAEPRHEAILGKLMLAASEVAKIEDLNDGYRIVINDGPSGCQSVYHLHVHVIGGRQLTWPPG